MELLEDPHQSCIVNLVAVALEDRPPYFAGLLSALLDLRARTGRPQWLVVDECHHLFPASLQTADILLPSGLTSVMWITIHPDHAARPLLRLVDTVVAVGDAPVETLAGFGRAVGATVPPLRDVRLQTGEALVWRWRAGAPPERIATFPPRTERRRHRRKYAQGELAPELSFYFRGPQARLNLRAQNLSLFMQSAEGVDDETWLFHLRRGDYSRWFREVIKDDALAEAAREIEQMKQASAGETRRLVRQQIEKRYSAPA